MRVKWKGIQAGTARIVENEKLDCNRKCRENRLEWETEKMRGSAGKWTERGKAEMRITRRQFLGENNGKWISEKKNRGGNAKI